MCGVSVTIAVRRAETYMFGFQDNLATFANVCEMRDPPIVTSNSSFESGRAPSNFTFTPENEGEPTARQ